jgi:release factor glutamine methyltransferase
MTPLAPPAHRVWTILDLLGEATSFLQARGVESARVNAEVLLGHVLGLARVELYTRFDRTVEAEPLAAFRELVRGRLAHVPLQYLTGAAEFYSRRFAVRPGVFIPRPETELLVERALEALRGARCGDAARLVDVGVGSGAVLVTLLAERPGATGVGVDASPAALAAARENAERHGVGDRADLRAGSVFDPLDPTEIGSFDLVVANPPYLSATQLDTLAPEVRDHEPRAALVAGGDGLDALRALVAGAGVWLRPGGALALEIGETQGTAVLALAAAAGYADPILSRDHAGKERIVVARRSEA